MLPMGEKTLTKNCTVLKQPIPFTRYFWNGSLRTASGKLDAGFYICSLDKEVKEDLKINDEGFYDEHWCGYSFLKIW
jgi:hypothetical protein